MPPRAPPLSPAGEPELDLTIDLGFETGNTTIDQADPGFELDQSLREDDSAQDSAVPAPSTA